MRPIWIALLCVGLLVLAAGGKLLQSGATIVGEVEVLSVEPSTFPTNGGNATLKFRARIYDYWADLGFTGDYKISAGGGGVASGSLASIGLTTSWKEGSFPITISGGLTAGGSYTVSAYGKNIAKTYAVLQGVKTFQITAGPPSATHKLTIAVYPEGYGTTNPLPGVYTHNHGATVTVTATPNEGYKFNHWSGDYDSVVGTTATITMNADKSITARFVTGGEMPREVWWDIIKKNWAILAIAFLIGAFVVLMLIR